MKTYVLLAALLGLSAAMPSGLEARQDDGDDSDAVLVDEAYLQAAMSTVEATANSTSTTEGGQLVRRFIPPGRIWQDCTVGTDTDFGNSERAAAWLQAHPGKHFAPQNKCRRVHKDHHTCFWLCAKGDTGRHVHNHRIGAIAADINVGCHEGDSGTVHGKDIFDQYNIWVTNTCS